MKNSNLELKSFDDDHLNNYGKSSGNVKLDPKTQEKAVQEKNNYFQSDESLNLADDESEDSTFKERSESTLDNNAHPNETPVLPEDNNVSNSEVSEVNSTSDFNEDSMNSNYFNSYFTTYIYYYYYFHFIKISFSQALHRVLMDLKLTWHRKMDHHH